ncbi:MAG: radical SAM protein [Gemmatimonadota bacterium]|nr:radical SAM protein [Gemmatimonadota bacterium]
MNQKLSVTEIFYSIQGESTWAGAPCTFVRLTGCPLRCSWCDTEYAFHGGSEMGLDEVVAEIASHSCKTVEITGGEPLAQKGVFPLADRLLSEGYIVLLETSGALDVSRLDPRVHKIMDLKCPGSMESDRNRWENLNHLTERDEIKFVIQDRTDYQWARNVIRQRELDQRVEEGSLRALLISPVWEAIDLESLSTWILEDRLPVRLQIQMHKLIWEPDRQGV